MTEKRWGLPLILGIAFGLIWAATLASPLISGFAAAVSLGCFVVAGGLSIQGLRRGKYDLRELQRVHEREELDSIEVGAPEDADGIVCVHCGTVYDRRIPVCPNCRQMH